MVKESIVPADWFKKADMDLKSARILFSSGILQIAAFHIQQTIEKYLKGYLLSRGWQLKKTHDLVSLLNEAVKYEPKLEDFRGLCMQATEYYIEDRYPFLIKTKLRREELNKTFKEVEKLIRLIKKIFKASRK